jgi:predicted lipoprotein with Yx(FWY)xxD motif
MAVIALGLLTLAGCGGSGGSSSSGQATSSSSSASTSSSTSAAALKTADTSLGTVVVDGKGMTVYYFDKDVANSGTSNCSGECLAKWPAVTATSDSPTVDGVTGQVGVITRDDGTKQITLNGLPLYLWAGDAKPGDVTGQAVGGVWWVVGPDGTKITTQPSMSGSPSSLKAGGSGGY